MENLKEAALYFEELKNYSYKINLIKKKKQYELNIIFRDCDFWHAVGLGEQARIEEFKCNKGSLYQRILADDQTLFDILDSSEGFYEEMYVERRKDFLLIKQCLESDSVVFKSVGKLKGSKIKCDFIISAELDVCNEGKEVVKKKYWIFLTGINPRRNSQSPNPVNKYSICSCFSNDEQNYNDGQTHQKIIYKSYIFDDEETVFLNKKTENIEK